MYHPSRLSPQAREGVINRTQSSGALVSLEGRIRILEFNIRATLNLRTFHYITGDMPQARLTAIRIGVKRSELRRLQRGM